MRDKYLVVFSGGQDSTTCLAWALNKAMYKQRVECITFDYGQRHSIELEKAAAICKDIGVRQKLVDVRNLGSITTSALLDGSDIVTGSDGIPTSKVEGRNMLFLTYAAIYAKSRNIKNIVTGVCETDFSGYPDCRDVFIKSLNTTLNLAMDYNFQIHTPLMWLNKALTWHLAHTLDSAAYVYLRSHTCYNGVQGGCGECPACKLRNAGWQEFLETLAPDEKQELLKLIGEN